MTRQLALVVMLSLVGVSPGLAQSILTLEAAQAEARAHAPDVAELDASVRGAETVAAQAARKLRQNPEVSGAIGPGALVGRPEELSWNLGASLPIDISGSWKPRAASAQADLARAQQDREAGLRALDERVAGAVADVALRQRALARLARIAELLQLAADAAHRQFDVGQGTQLDADSADLDLASARVTLEHGRGELGSARVTLARLLGRTVREGLVVADPVEQPIPSVEPNFEAIVEQDPRIRASAAELEAAKFEDQMFARLTTPSPSFGVAYGYQRRDIPAGSFSGAPFANSLTALWPDRELTFNLSMAVPLFDRQQEPRARATARILAAEAKLQSTRADVRAELTTAWETLQAASRALQAAGPMSGTIDRDVAFVEQAVRAGAFDSVQRTQALRRLIESGQVTDSAVRDFRTARAAWLRRTGSR
jgi:outer membrane protein TolC